MKLFSLVVGFALLHVSALAAEESHSVPLDQIWAYKMPGTRSIEEFATRADMRLLGSVFESWFIRAEKLKFNEVTRPGFAVSGNNVSAMRAALANFVEGGKPRGKFSPDDEITIVFFSEPSGGNHVRIEQVEWNADRIVIQYRLEPYFESALSQTFALIPIGTMPVGKYRVEMEQLSREQKFINWGYKPLDKDWSRKVLCRPFRFTVTERGE